MFCLGYGKMRYDIVYPDDTELNIGRVAYCIQDFGFVPCFINIL